MNIKHLLRKLALPLLCLILTGLCGCKAVDQKVGFTYSRPNQPPGKQSGEITVIRPAAQSATKNSKGEWIVGSLNNVHGVHQADLLSDRSPEEWISDALLHELKLAGYSVKLVDSLPPGVPRGIVLTNIKAFLTVNKGIASADVRHELRFNVETILNGNRGKTFSVAARDDRTVLLDSSLEEKEAILLKTLQDAMAQILPEVVALTGKK